MRALRSAASAALSLALLVGVPWLLSATIGNPLDRLPDLLAGDINDHVVLAALAAALYLAWAQFAVAFAVELVSAVRRTPMPRRIPGVFAGQQGLARALVSGALLLLPVAASTVVPAAQVIAMTPSHHPAVAITQPATHHPGAAEGIRSAPSVVTREVTVTGDGSRTWWDLAATHLGDGSAWKDLWDLNQGRTQADATVLTSERAVLRPGWTVLVPGTPDDESPDAPSVVTGEAGGGGIEVAVQQGDTFSEIAADHGVQDWTTVWPYNAGRAEPGGARFDDPDYIEPGWVVTIPSAAAPGGVIVSATGDNAVEVAEGDTLSQIAAANNVPLDAVVAANIGRMQPDGSQLTNPDDIRPGWQILIPTGDVTHTNPVADSPQTTEPSTPAEPSVSTPVTDPPPSMSHIPSDAPQAEPAPTAQQPAATSPFVTDRAGDAAVPAGSESDDQTGDRAVVPWVAGSGLLASGALLALVRHRRRQFRYRSPGRSITRTPAELQDTERALLTAGPAGMGDITFLDTALRSLTDANGERPEVAAARLTGDALVVVLDVPYQEPPEPWRSDEAGTRWTLSRADEEHLATPGPTTGYAPYPTLVSVGHTPAGEQWLLDLEQRGVLSLTGDTDRCLDLARFMAAELAHNGWSDMVDVTLVGFGAEMTALNPERLTHTDHLEKAIDTANRALFDDAPLALDEPVPMVVLVAATAASKGDNALPALIDQLEHRGRSAVAVVLAGTETDEAATDTPGGWTLRIDRDGTLTIPALDVQLLAEQLPKQEAADLAALLALAAATEDQPMPASRGDEPWDEYSDAAGNPLQEQPDHDGPMSDAAAASEAVSSALPLPPRAYFDNTAADQADLDNLAPRVPVEVRERIENSDADLDADLDDWFDDKTGRPRITVLGPVQVRAQGDLPAGRPRLAWHTEVVAYLATRPRGATVEEFGTALWPDDPNIVGRPKLRNSIYVVRKWLGVDPSTGQEYLPSNTRLGGGAYRIVGGLLDAELFRRLRLRGAARGEHGIPDLQRALDLVTGAPFDRQRPGGYGWLVDPALDHDYTAAIADVAHLVATHHLAAGEPAAAAAAAHVALLAGSSADTPLLDLVAASEAMGNTAEAEAYVKRIMANHDAEVEEDLPPRTAAILHRRQWLPPAA